MASQDLVREVFGGSDSELSDEEEVSKKTLRQAKPRDEYESSGADSGDDYVQEKHLPSVVGKAKKIKRKRTLDADGQPRKRKRRIPVEPDLVDLTPEQGIDEILKQKKTTRRKKKTNDEVLDSFADHEVARLREAMNAAAEEDINANHDKQPAVAKLKLLPEAMDTLRKASLAQSIIDNNLLDAVRRWLEPLPDRSLPALNIQRELFGVVRKMEFIDSAVLKESGLGRIVLFYTKCKRVTPDIGRIANDLVMTWARPIVKRSASYRDRIVPVVQDGDSMHRSGENLNAILARAKENEKGRVKKNAVMIPQRELGNYTVAPKVNGGIMRNNASVDVDIERRKKTSEWMRALTRKINSRSQGISSVAIALPNQPLPKRCSSLLSAASSPRTPSGSPKWSPIFFSSAANRNSTDSWNSSNGPDELEFEWKPEQILLLTRTLDALPAHLVTPFIGPVPPSNLLDKIARGVSQAKGSLEWPHSIRATRVKLLELARKRAKEDSLHQRKADNDYQERENKFDPDSLNGCGNQDGKLQTARRPLYRQNSMDFITATEPQLRDEENITRLSNRLQRSDKLVPTSIYYPYTRKSRPLTCADGLSSSPPRSTNVPSLINPSTPSSSTLTSLTSLTSSAAIARTQYLRYSASSLSAASSMSTSSGGSSNLCLQKPRTTGTNIPPSLPPKDLKSSKLGMKRAPSFGAAAQGIRRDKWIEHVVLHQRRDSVTSSCPSSDEEEKLRAAQVKKQKVRSSITSTPNGNANSEASKTQPSIKSSRFDTPQKKATNGHTLSTPIITSSGAGLNGVSNTTKKVRVSNTSGDSRSGNANKRLPMNVQRNPSILGGELPPLTPLSREQNDILTPLKHADPDLTETQPATPILTPPLSPECPLSPASRLLSPTQPTPSPSEPQKLKTLRRVKRRALGRRISFGSLASPSIDDATMEELDSDKRICLGSAFQMH
ncbi:hypothetical protein AMATHDRAFT_73710 [Amanita thiersii Skay4041]|uniref:TFIIS N-terminal domain-containing protein n=1 Tax=Amanita thiersii Skay4041 TaxID=703135 RepID=A0A2A9NYV7_9AGAR|nr:hypothetical protein AMATHDRAFT_73710 [Amanita thiersii Skay4041]